MPTYYPLHLSIAGKKCLVVGGGKTAARKVATLLRCGGRVEVVSPDAVPAIRALARREKIHWRERKFRASDCAGAFLIFAATASVDTNRSIARLAKEKSILANVADSPADCDFIVPALVKRGHLTISIATEGLAPVLSSRIRKDLERFFGPEYVRYTRLIGGVRCAIVRNQRLTGKQKRKALQSLPSLPLRERLALGENISPRDVLKKLGIR
jgi:precorrin-2 dehydrogenase/sirohydrochlorin ferrochelatase